MNCDKGVLAMTVTELWNQAQSLSPEEKKELAQLLLASLEDEEESEGKTAGEILTLLEKCRLLNL
jgi:hypothetical protein